MSTIDTDCCGTIKVAYYRSSDGSKVHRESCTRRGRGSVPWHYAARELDNDHDRVLAEIASLPWLTACGFCMSAPSTRGTTV